VLIENEHGILLVQRAHDPYAGWWMLPAGFVEYGEQAWDTAVREAEEETGLRVELTGLQGLYYGADDPRGVSHLAVYGARVVGGELYPADDACAIETFARDSLPERIAFENHRAAIDAWAREAGWA
jgi:8-oxo-dGTP diphosphatase